MPLPRFRFWLRTLLIVVVLICAVSEWAADSLEWIAERHLFLEYQMQLYAESRAEPPFSLWVFGEPGYAYICWAHAPDDVWTLEAVQRLFPEAEIRECVGTETTEGRVIWHKSNHAVEQ